MPLEQTADICLPPELLHCDDNMNNDRAITEKCSIDLQSHTSLSVPLQHQQCDCVEVIPPMTPTTSQQCKTNIHPFHSYRKRASRKNSLNSFSRRNRSKLTTPLSSKWAPSLLKHKADLIAIPETIVPEREHNWNNYTKPNDNSRVSPTSIVDLNHSESSNNSSDAEDKNDLYMSSSSSSSSLDYVMELKQLQHPLTEIVSDQGGVSPILTEKVRLVRTCTPRDTLLASSQLDESENMIIDANETHDVARTDAIEYDIIKAPVGFSQFTAIPDARPLRRFRSLPSQWSSKASKSRSENDDLIRRDDTNKEKKEAKPMHTRIRSMSNMCKTDKNLATALKKQQSWPLLSQMPHAKAPLNVRFNEIMEVRYFYRSDDEIEIMKQCAIERRVQQELRRRLRRRFRKGQSLTLSSNQRPIAKNNFLSLFSNSWTTTEEKTYSEYNSADAKSYDMPDGSIVNCGIQFDCYDGDDDADRDKCHDQVVLNDGTATICKSKKSWIESFIFPVPTLSGFTSSDQTERAAARTTSETSANYINHLTDGLSSIKFNEIFDYGLTTKNDNASVVTTLDPLNGTPTTSPVTEEENLGEVDNTEPLWFVTALTCGSNTKLQV